MSATSGRRNDIRLRTHSETIIELLTDDWWYQPLELLVGTPECSANVLARGMIIECLEIPDEFS